MAEHDETRLPKWAQTELRRLRGNLQSLEREVMQVETGDTDTWIEEGLEQRALPRGSRVRFDLEDSHITANLKDDGAGPYVEVYHSGGMGGFVFDPTSSNMGRLWAGKRWYGLKNS